MIKEYLRDYVPDEDVEEFESMSEARIERCIDSGICPICGGRVTVYLGGYHSPREEFCPYCGWCIQGGGY